MTHRIEKLSVDFEAMETRIAKLERELADGRSEMTLRDWFAGMALQGMLADHTREGDNHERRSVTAYRYADAMLAARKEASRE